MSESGFHCHIVFGEDESLGVLEPLMAFTDEAQAHEWALEHVGSDNYSVSQVPVARAKDTMLERMARRTPGVPMWVSDEFLEDLLYRVLRGDRFISRFPEERSLRFHFVGHDGCTMRTLFHAETDALSSDCAEFRPEFRTAGDQAVVVSVLGTGASEASSGEVE